MAQNELVSQPECSGEYVNIDQQPTNLGPKSKTYDNKRIIYISIIVTAAAAVIGLVTWLIVTYTSGKTPVPDKPNLEDFSRIKIKLEDWNFSKELPSDMDFSKDIPNPLAVVIPHTWNNFDGQDGGNNYSRIAAIYQKTIFIDDIYRDKKIFIEFHGVSIVATVYLNDNEFIGKHIGAFATFRFDITKNIKFNAYNRITVIANNTLSTNYYPYNADFTFFGGMYRDVNLVVVNSSHFDLNDKGSLGLYLTPKIIGNKGHLDIRVLPVFDDVDVPPPYEIQYTITEQNNSKNVIKGKMDKSTSVVIDNPHLWDGIVDPFLYNCDVCLIVNGKITDKVSHHFGFRTIEIDRNGFFLNHRKYRLNGVNRHQDRLDKGWAISAEDEEEDFQLIYEMGANAVRFAHYQQNQTIFNICDRRGFIVWVEVPFIQKFMDTKESNENIKEQFTEMIKQNYNHPSVAVWGLMNELADNDRLDNEIKVLKEMIEIQQTLDPNRITTGAITPNYKASHRLPYVADVNGYNFYCGWYYDKINDTHRYVDDLLVHSDFHPMAISEYGGDANIKFHSDNPKAKDYSEEYQFILHSKTYEIYLQKNLWGTFIWNMFEFAVDDRDEGGVKGRNNKGMVTYDRKIKKDAFYYYKAMWRSADEDPFVHICGHRFHDRATNDVNVTITSNLKNINVFLNDNLLFVEENFLKYKVFQLYLKKGINIVRAVSGKYEDTVEFEKVDEPNPDYVLK